jgi:RimJ/RimL family protein N-acetyltransferase
MRMIEISEPIRTRRLVLRPFAPRDEEDMLEFESRPDVARFLLNEPRDRVENARQLAIRQSQTALRSEGDALVLAVDLDGTAIGYVLLVWLSEPHRQGEFGYVMNPAHHGHGYATEAAVEMLRLGFERLGLHRIVGRCDARNQASAKLMERVGLRKEAHFIGAEIFKGEWGEELRYAMLEDEWRASRWASAT